MSEKNNSEEVVVKQKSILLGKQDMIYLKDFKTGETGLSRKISVGVTVDLEKGEGFGMMCNTYTVNGKEFDEAYEQAEYGDSCMIITERTTFEGKQGVKVKQFLIKKSDGRIIGLDF